VTEVKASIGDTVHPGQVLATVTSREISGMITDLFKAENELSADLSRDVLQIDCEIEQERAEVALCEKQCNRAKLLMEERIGSLAVLEAAQTNLKKHEITLNSLLAKRAQTINMSNKKKRLARQALEQKLKVLGMPISTIDMVCSRDKVVSSVPLLASQKGLVLDRDINVGELVEPSRTLFVIDDIDNLWLEANVFEKDVEQVKQGQPIEFIVDSFPNEVFKGDLSFVAGVLNPTTRTLAVRSVIDNPKLKLKPKMFARMKIFVGKKAVLALPTSAIQDAGSHKVVFVQKSANLFEQRQVELGEQIGKFVAVLDGVDAGEMVVTKGSMPLRALVLRKMR
ncbi:MAG: efflux RND transporter periplasmic adaptor subunit, partial [Cyanobacteria bacterium]|nr:efflux RND transporter periplasmic adaptor subunit [Cyanobacteriota bacterium]